ncbi:MAG: PhnD/SsuA/transferrin family substrate-binding protein [Burkholderiaceae bacterium]|nr:PhnD/SsuA/transferrin family substrate-binding protein [Burkholderiaceae bacterium]
MKCSTRLLALFALTLSFAHLAWADDWIFAVNEGVTYQDGGPVPERYKLLQDMLEKELKHPIQVKSVDRYGDLEKGLQEGRYEMAFIHPAHVGLRAVKSGNYVGLATAAGYTDYRGRVLVAKESTLRTMDELRGKKVGVPALESITTVMFSATMKDMGEPNPAAYYTATRYQDAVPFMVDNKFTEAGVSASSAVIKAWTAKGGRILGETKAVPIKQFLVSTRLSAEQRDKVRELMLRLADSENGRQALKGTNMKGFVPWDDSVMNGATKWLGL